MVVFELSKVNSNHCCLYTCTHTHTRMYIHIKLFYRFTDNNHFSENADVNLAFA